MKHAFKLSRTLLALPAILLPMIAVANTAHDGHGAEQAAAMAAHDHDKDHIAAPPEARLYIISPQDGERVSSPVTVRFGLSGMGVAPAGVEKPGTGHHHLLVNLEPSQVNLHLPYPANDNLRHYGGGQTEASIELAPGTHTLQLLLGDHRHMSFNPPIFSEKITITVE